MLYVVAFITGLIGSVHCLGMCSPIAIAVANIYSPYNKAAIFLHQLGRMIIYMLLGLLIGSLKTGLNLGAFQQWLSLTSGVIIIVLIWMPSLMHRFKISWLENYISELKNIFTYQLRTHHILSPLIIGVLNGLLPCGFLYIGLAGSITAGHAYQSAFYMLFFGLGTVPLMAISAYGGKTIALKIKHSMAHKLPYLFTCIGLLFIVRGMGLGIPYISPAINSTPYSTPAVECHTH
jgi:sulfite exporter TauE/SafE